MPTVTHLEPGYNAGTVRVTADRLTDKEAGRATYTVTSTSRGKEVLVGSSGRILAGGVNGSLLIDGVVVNLGGSYNVSSTFPTWWLFTGITPGWHLVAVNGGSSDIIVMAV